MKRFVKLSMIGMKALTALLFTVAVLISPFAHAMAEQTVQNDSSTETIYVIPVKDTIERGLQSFLERAVREAEEAGADQIVFEINTFGGGIIEAEEIGQLIDDIDVPTTAFIEAKAISAGSYISLHADQIIMAPGTTIGDAAIVTISGERVRDSKQLSMWVGAMEAAAEKNGRNTLYAAGMVDDQLVIEVPEINKTFGEDQLITFTAEQALKAGYSEGTAESVEEVIDLISDGEVEVVNVELTLSENIARIVTHPVATVILLCAGLAGIVMELIIPGFGVPGLVGIFSFALYFFGHMIAGFAGLEHIILFIVGIVLLLAEIFIPSFGILGIAGVISVIVGVVLAAYDTGNAIFSLFIAVVAAIIFLFIMTKLFKRKGIWNKFILRDQLTEELGYSSQQSKQHLIGKRGKALSVLRPSGVALLEGERVDVVTAGDYIEAGNEIEVIQIEGSRIVVKKIEDER